MMFLLLNKENFTGLRRKGFIEKQIDPSYQLSCVYNWAEWMEAHMGCIFEGHWVEFCVYKLSPSQAALSDHNLKLLSV